MAYKILAFVVLNLVLVHAVDTEPEEPCLCLKDEMSVWEFLQTLSKDVPEEEKDIYAVFPGELSPLTECECGTERRKRKVLDSDNAPVESPVDLPVDSAKVDSPAEADSADQRVRAKKSLSRGPCPSGQVKFGTVCINDGELDY